MDRLDRLEAVLLEMRASLLRRLDRQDEAIADLQRVLDLVPERSSAYAEIARTYEERGAYAEAIESYHQYLDVLPVGAVEEKARIKLHIDDLQTRVDRQVRQLEGGETP
jgi:tetratricopeptide (TPR) repeat protein